MDYCALKGFLTIEMPLLVIVKSFRLKQSISHSQKDSLINIKLNIYFLKGEGLKLRSRSLPLKIPHPDNAFLGAHAQIV